MKFKGNKIKVLFVLPSLEYGGAERALLNVVNNINREKFQPLLCVLSLKGGYLDSISKDIKIFDLKKTKARKAIFALKKVIEKEKPDIVLGTVEQIRILLLFVKNISKHKPIFINRCESFQSRVKYPKIVKFFSELSLRYIDYVLAISQKMANDLIENHRVKKERVVVIHNPVDIENIRKLAKEPVDQRYFSSRPVILGCGRLTEAKGFSFLIKAMPLVLKRYPNAKLIIIGNKGEQEKYLKNLPIALGIKDNVEFINFQKNPFKFMANSDVFVSSSLWETAINALTEAMVCGTPIVSTTSLSPEFLDNGKIGILVPPANEKALAEGILKILDNRELAREFSEKGKIKSEEFGIDKIMEKYEDFFERILNEG